MAKSIGRLLFSLSFVFMVFGVFAQKGKSFSCPDYIVRTMMEKYHCCPRPVNELFSKSVLNDFINTLDERHLVFTAADIKEIQGYRQKLDEELAGKNQDFIKKVLPLYEARLRKADSTLQFILQKPFDFSVPETIVFANDSSDYARDEIEYKQRWSKWLKYEMLSQMSETAADDSVLLNMAFVKANEAAVRARILKNERRILSDVLEPAGGYAAYLAATWCSTLANAYDPHSDFLPAAEKEDFTDELSNQELIFGIQTAKNEKGQVEIAHVAPGSAAWKSGEINKSDVLVSLKYENGKVVALADAEEEEVSRILSGIGHEYVELKIRKANGLEKTVKLQKQKMSRDEDFVKSFILKGKQKIGYISLPGFYSEWKSTEGISCANDVAKEIMKLRKENIEGLILDLSDNGGGYIDEAMQLAGIFVEEGTLGIAAYKGKNRSMKDPNRGTMYDGPLLVMVNGSSASASEFVAGALQDYNRAIIAGSPSFGKATMQTIMPADTTFNYDEADSRDMDDESKEYVKITLGKIYRASGRTNQFGGVQPDVLLPEISAGFSYRESSMKNALSADTVKRALYYTPLQPLPLRELAAKSYARVDADSSFMAVKKAGEVLKELYDRMSTSVSLQPETFYAMEQKYRDEIAQVSKWMKQEKQQSYTAENNQYDKQVIEVDEYAAGLNAYTLKNISSNIYIHESFRILADYIQLLNKK